MRNKIKKENIQEGKPLYNSRIILAYIKLIESKYHNIDIAGLLSFASMTLPEVLDEGHWFNQRQIDKFYYRLVSLTGNTNIAREAGRFAALKGSVGAINPFVLGMIGPTNVFKMLGKISRDLTRSSIYETRKISGNKVEIKVIPVKGIKERPFQCENRSGLIEAVVIAFNYTSIKVYHPECVFRGDSICRYIISWEKKAVDRFNNFLNIMGLGTLFVLMYILFFVSYYSVRGLILMIVPVLLFLFLKLIAVNLKNNELKKRILTINDSSSEMLEQIKRTYDNAHLINQIGGAINKQVVVKGIINNVERAIEEILDFSRGVILLVNTDGTALKVRGGFGYGAKDFKLFSKVKFNINQKENKSIFVDSFLKQKPCLIEDVESIKEEFKESYEFARDIRSQAFICCPIISDKKAIGILAVDNPEPNRPLIQSDLNLIMGVASIIGVSVRNAQLLEFLKEQFKSILEVLGASIDARDPLTSGHSSKVKEFSLGICDELKVSSDYKEVVGIAASLHDYGKIGIDDALLKKNGKLTPEEYEIIKTHVAKTREILEQINFTEKFKQIPEIAGAHHEKMDGSGYPQGLKGEEIPFGAQIIAVADFFEAITAHRHYREPMPLKKAFGLLMEESGSSFNPKIVDAFLSYYKRKNSIKE